MHRKASAQGALTLDRLPVGQRAIIVGVDWSRLVAEEAQRLRALGIDVGARVAVAHRGVFLGRDPLAVTVGRMTVALRRMHAGAMTVEPIAAVAPGAADGSGEDASGADAAGEEVAA